MLDDLQCTGLEYRLFECVHRGIGIHSCSHSQDVGVRCIAGKASFQSYSKIFVVMKLAILS